MPSVATLLSFAEHLFEVWGIWLVPLGAFLENSVILGFIFPGVTVIVFSGYVARVTGESIWAIVALATIGAFLGDNLDYFIGRRSGKLLENKPLFSRYIAAVEPFLAKYGVYAVFLGRFSGWSRAWVAVASGATKFSYLKFVIASFFSAVIWTSAWIVGGYLLGGNKQLIEEWLGKGSLIAWIGLLVLLVYYFRTRIKLVLDLMVFTSKKYGRKAKNKIQGNG